MKRVENLEINLSPTKVIVAIPDDLNTLADAIEGEDVKDICKRHGIDAKLATSLTAYLKNCAIIYRRLEVALPQTPLFAPTISSRKDAEALFDSLETFLKLFTSPAMVPRVWHAYSANCRKLSPEQIEDRYEKTVSELEALLGALNSAIEFDGRAHIAFYGMNHDLRFTALHLLKYWNDELGRTGRLSGRGGDNTAMGFVADCLGLITGKPVSDEMIRGSHIPQAAKKKRTRVRVRKKKAS